MSFCAQVQPSSFIQRIQQGCWIENPAGDCKSQYNSEKVGSMLLCLWIGETEKKKCVICVLDISVPELCPDPGKDEMHSGFMLGEINLDFFTVSREAKEGWLLAVFSSFYFHICTSSSLSLPVSLGMCQKSFGCSQARRIPSGWTTSCTGAANWLLHPTVNEDANFDCSLVQL